MAKKQKKNKTPTKVWELYDVQGDKVVRKNKVSPKAGNYVFMANHKDRWTCGKTGYTEMKKKE